MMALDVLTIWIPMLVLGAGMGFLGGIFGIGGGIIAIPILILTFSMDQTTAQGTAAAMMVPNLLIAWWRYAQKNALGFDRRTLLTAVVATVTTWIAANAAQYVAQGFLQILFAIFLALLGLSRLLPFRREVRHDPAPAKFIPLVGLAGGTSMGLLGVGGGLVAAPILTGVFGLGQRAAQTIGLALVTPSAGASLAAYAMHGRVDWPISIALAAGGLFTVAYGVKVAHSWSEEKLQRAFGWLMIAMAIVIVCKAIW